MQKLTLKIISAALATVILGTGCADDDPLKNVAAAKQFIEKKDLNSARIEIKSALNTNPDLGEARFILGTILLGEGNPGGAEVEFRKAIAAKYPEHLVAPALARSMLATGQAAKVIEEMASKHFAQTDVSADLNTTLAFAYSAVGREELAEAALKTALAADPNYAPALIAKARQQAAAKDFAGAMRTADEVISRQPANADAWKLKGDLLLYAFEKTDEALAAYRKSTEVTADFAPGHIALLMLLMQLDKLDDATRHLEVLKKYSPNHPQTRYFEAELAFRKKDFKQARDLAQQLLLVSKDNPRLLVLLGSAELQLDSLVQAESYFVRAVLAAPNYLMARRLLVTTYLKSGQSAKALASLNASAGADGIDPSLFWLAGEVYLQNGDAKRAEEYFVKAAKVDPGNSRTATALAVSQMAGNQSDSAFAQLDKLARSDSGIMADLALITAHMRRNEYDQALAAIDKLGKKQPGKPFALKLRGQVQLAQKDVAGARKSFEQALALDSSYFAAAAGLAELDMADKKPEDAKKRFDALLAKNPKNEQAWLALAQLAVRTGASNDEIATLLGKAIDANPSEIKARLLLIELHVVNKNFKLAMEAAQSGVATLPNSTEMLDALGRVQQLSGDPNQALITYGKLIPMQPRSPVPHIRIAEAYVAGKNKPAAERSLRKALELEPRALDAQAGLISLLSEAKNFSEAIKIARTIQQQRPKSPIGYQLEGDILATQKNLDAAVKAYQSGLQQAPSTMLAVKLHSVLVLSGKVPEAFRFAAAWTKDHPKDAAFLVHLGDMAIARQDLPLAERHYLAALQAQPGHAGALNNLAWVMGRLGKDGAIGYAEQAVKIAPNQAAYWDTLAALLADSKAFDKALEMQKKAVALQPSDPAKHLNLARIYAKAGEKAKAKAELDALSKLGGSFPRQPEVDALLKSL